MEFSSHTAAKKGSNLRNLCLTLEMFDAPGYMEERDFSVRFCANYIKEWILDLFKHAVILIPMCLGLGEVGIPGNTL